MISSERLAELERIEAKMTALEAGGVDNWEGYSVSLESWHAEAELEELISEYTTLIVNIALNNSLDFNLNSADTTSSDGGKASIAASLREYAGKVKDLQC